MEQMGQSWFKVVIYLSQSNEEDGRWNLPTSLEAVGYPPNHLSSSLLLAISHRALTKDYLIINCLD
jgi:hypothetical protein